MDIGQCDSIVIILAPFTTTVPGLLSVYPVAIHRASLHKRRHGGGGKPPTASRPGPEIQGVGVHGERDIAHAASMSPLKFNAKHYNN